MENNEATEFSWSIFPDVTPNFGAAGRVWFAQPLVVAPNILAFSGYVEHGNPDTVIRILCGGEHIIDVVAAPGFLVTLPVKAGNYYFQLWIGGECIHLWEIRRAKISDSKGLPADLEHKSQSQLEPFALHGSLGQLFLGGDSNDSIGQFTEDRNLDDSSIAGWNYVFKSLKFWKSNFDIDNISVLIAPAKEEIFKEYYPYERARRSVLDHFMLEFRDFEVVFPKWDLLSKRYFSYSSTDTHWTDYGATIGASAVLRAWSYPEKGLPDSFRIIQRIGDLGSKVTPHLASYELCFSREFKERLVFDNGISNQGNIRIFRNPDAPRSESLLIFGDSFGTNLATAFAGVFRQVTYVYQPAGFDPDLVRIIRPQNVLLQITQRFLHGQPATGKSVFSNGLNKLMAMEAGPRAAAIDRMSSVPKEFIPLVAPILSAL